MSSSAQTSTLPTDLKSAVAPVTHPYRVRDLSSLIYSEIWLVAAVTTILGTRLYLALTGYPQVGSSTLHIAHMLWGGLGMVLSFGILLLTASAVWKPAAALIGGFGFGLFIDELGKFITKDNDYFFRPAIGLIYAVLVILFLLARSLERIDRITDSDHILYATQCLDQYVIGRLDEDGRRSGLMHLEQSAIDTSYTRSLRELLEGLVLPENDQQSRLVTWRDHLASRYWKVVSTPWLRRGVLILFAVQVVVFVGSLTLAVTASDFSLLDSLSFGEIGTLVSGFISGFFSVWGIIRIFQGKRLDGYKALIVATLVNLLFGQFFAFASNQFAALGSLVLQLVILGVLRIAVTVEGHTNLDGSPHLPLAELQALDDTDGK